MFKQEQFILEKELIAQAAKHLSVQLDPTDGKDEHLFSYNATTRALGAFSLTPQFIAFLEKNGFEVGNGTGDRKNMFYVTDRACGNTTVNGVYNSHNWAWDRKKADEKDSYQFEPKVMLSVNATERGVELSPEVSGNNSGGPVWGRTIRRMAWALATHFPEVHPALKMFAASQDGAVVLPFADFGHAGIRSVSALFDEYFGGSGKNAVRELAKSRMSPFVPQPYIDDEALARGSTFFLLEQFHGALRRQWQEQLEAHRRSLAV